MRLAAARLAMPAGVPRRASGLTRAGTMPPTGCVTIAATPLAARRAPARDQMTDHSRDGLVRFDAVDPQTMHGLRGERGRGAADDRRQVDAVDDVLRDAEQVHLVHGRIEVDGLDDLVDVDVPDDDVGDR